MNKENKKVILAVIITAVLTFCITATATYLYTASDIEYNPADTSFEVNNIKEAIDYLYEQDKEYIKVKREDLGSRVTINTTGYKLTSGTLSTNLTEKKITINILLDIVTANTNPTFDISLADLGITKIKSFTYYRNGTGGDFRFHQATATPENVHFHIDTNYGSGNKYPINLTINIDYE